MPVTPLICHLSFNHGPFDDRIYWKELVALTQNGYDTVHISIGKSDEDFITAEGIRIIQIKKKTFSANGWLNRMAQLLFFKKSTAYKVLEKAVALKAAVYHYHDLQLNALTKRLKKQPWQPKVIYDAHEAYHLLLKENTPDVKWQQPLYRLFLKSVTAWELNGAKHCDYIIATDAYTLDYFEKKLPATPKSIVYNYSYFLPESGNAGLSKKYHFIYTGLLSKGRGIIEIISAIALLKKDRPAVRLLLIGPFETDDFKKETETLINRLHLTENVCIHPPVAFREIAAFYNESLVGLGLFQPTPKYTTFIPIKLFEYMAFGLPVIFSNHGPSARMIQQADCGILVEPNNTQAICEAMMRLLSDKTLYGNCSANAQKAVRERYNWNIEKEKLLAIYETLL